MRCLHCVVDFGQSNSIFYKISALFEHNFCLAPLWNIRWAQWIYFFCISPLKSLNLVLIPGAKLDGHWGTWTGCLTEINESSTIAKKRISLESDTVKHLTAFRIISSEMPISLLIRSWWWFSCLYIEIFFLLSYELKMCFSNLYAQVYRSTVSKCDSLWKVDIIFISKC